MHINGPLMVKKNDENRLRVSALVFISVSAGREIPSIKGHAK